MGTVIPDSAGISQQLSVQSSAIGFFGSAGAGKSSSPNAMVGLAAPSDVLSAVFIALHLSLPKPFGWSVMLPDSSMTSSTLTSGGVADRVVAPQEASARPASRPSRPCPRINDPSALGCVPGPDPESPAEAGPPS